LQLSTVTETDTHLGATTMTDRELLLQGNYSELIDRLPRNKRILPTFAMRAALERHGIPRSDWRRFSLLIRAGKCKSVAFAYRCDGANYQRCIDELHGIMQERRPDYIVDLLASR
jgi:hypothetical protein